MLTQSNNLQSYQCRKRKKFYCLQLDFSKLSNKQLQTKPNPKQIFLICKTKSRKQMVRDKERECYKENAKIIQVHRFNMINLSSRPNQPLQIQSDSSYPFLLVVFFQYKTTNQSFIVLVFLKDFFFFFFFLIFINFFKNIL